METGRCAADGVMVVTYASPMNQTMQLVPYGKLAATFVDVRTHKAVRVYENQPSRVTALNLPFAAASPWEKQVQAYQVLPDDALLHWQAIIIMHSLHATTEKHRTTCAHCGERVNDHHEIEQEGCVLCKACANGAYYGKAV